VQLPEGENFDFIDIEARPKHHTEPDKFRLEWNKFKLWDLKMSNHKPIVHSYSMGNSPTEGNIVMLNVACSHAPF